MCGESLFAVGVVEADENICNGIMRDFYNCAKGMRATEASYAEHSKNLGCAGDEHVFKVRKNLLRDQGDQELSCTLISGAGNDNYESGLSVNEQVRGMLCLVTPPDPPIDNGKRARENSKGEGRPKRQKR